MIVGAACCVTAWGVSAQGLSGVITGQIVSTSPVYHRTSDRQSAGTYAASSNLAVPYAVHEIRMPANGSVQVVVDNTTPFDSFLALYSSFNPANPQAGLLAADDDSAGYPHARLNVSGLRAATSYWLVIGSYSNQADAVYPPYGTYSVNVTVRPIDLTPTMLLLLN